MVEDWILDMLKKDFESAFDNLQGFDLSEEELEEIRDFVESKCSERLV